jgi:acetolactate synthase-1/3 small subunit
VLVKVKASAKTRSEVMQICEIFRTKIVNVDHNELIIELVGDSAKVTAFLDLLAPFGILELARTGTLALKR